LTVAGQKTLLLSDETAVEQNEAATFNAIKKDEHEFEDDLVAAPPHYEIAAYR
jgi:hypothetical protein